MDTNLSIRKTVRKSNALNEIRNSDITTSEYRLFCIYLAHFKMTDPNDNTVTFNLADYSKIVGLDRPRKNDIENQAKNILSRSVQIEGDDGGFTRYSLFDVFKLHKQEEAWVVTLECGHKLAPLIREERGNFIRYKLYNAIFLKSFNQQRIYELLKQYEKIGHRTIALEDLREYLSVKDYEYPVWGDFSQKVLKVAKKAIKDCTDISFEYEPIKKRGKVAEIKFIISKNEAYKDLLQLEGFLPKVTENVEYEDEEVTIYSKDVENEPKQTSLFPDVPEKFIYENSYFETLAEVCNFEFSQRQMEVITSTMDLLNIWEFCSPNEMLSKKRTFLKQKYAILNAETERRAGTKDKIISRFKFLLGIIENH